MKKLLFHLLVIAMAFSFQLSAKDGQETLFKKPEPSPEAVKRDRKTWEAKKERHLQRIRKKERMIDLNNPNRVQADNPMAVNIQTADSYTFWQEDYWGYIYMTGLCNNAGASHAANIIAEITFYDAGYNVLGTESAFVYGGAHGVQDGGGGSYCVGELAPGEYGFFAVWTYVTLADAVYYSVSYTADDSTAWPSSNAVLGFYGNVLYEADSYGDIEFYGEVENTGNNYIAYNTEVHMAAFNADNTKILDIDYDYVMRSDEEAYPYSVYPGAQKPFDVSLPYAPYAQASGAYMAAFEWYEAYYNAAAEKDPPFGALVIPSGGETLQSSWPVIGWALDDSGVERVDIYVWNNGGWLDIGDAVFVDGARPDIAALYPGYPDNTRAGWGYMLLSYFLPGGGNGSYTIKATAVDTAGKTTDLGTVTITNDNANAVKPFGAIDSPPSGGTASGSHYRNNGWALTPVPNTIPVDGSTINVYIDGTAVGKAHYNIYRSDIGFLFPGYNNSNGAAGYFDIDTTAYADGLHTIQWTAQDNAGNVDGIGSRYFTIDNSSRTTGKKAAARTGNFLSNAVAVPVRFTRASVKQMPAEAAVFIETKQAERVELQLTRPIAGYMKVGGRLEKLPTGSTLDPAKGTFSWLPLAPFMGRYELVFVEQRADGALAQRPVAIRVDLQK